VSKKSAALARIRQLACLGLPGGLFISSLLPVLRGLTESDSAAFFWLDETGGIANFYADHFPLLDAVATASAETPVFLSENAAWSETPLRPFAAAVLASTVESEMASNGLYNEILKRNGAHYILHGIARHGGVAIGRLSLFRSAAGRPFGLREISALSSVMRYVARGLAPHDSLQDDESDADEILEQELLIATRSGCVLHATERGRRLLLLSSGCPLGPRTLPTAASVSQQLLRAVCADGAANGNPVAAPSIMSRKTLWGRFELRGYCLSDEMASDQALVGVHVVRNQPARLRFVNAMSALPLSPQQREIALLIARGGSNRDIAARLSVSINTVAYHIKQLFYKLRVHDRAGLLARINSTVAYVEGEGACAVRIGIDPDARARQCTKTSPSTSTASSSRAAAAASRT
jgi:DNA-binding CsgD family transcriptional regulator